MVAIKKIPFQPTRPKTYSLLKDKEFLCILWNQGGKCKIRYNMEDALEFKNPLKLYHFCLKALVKQCVADNWCCSKEDFMLLPNHTIADFYEEVTIKYLV